MVWTSEESFHPPSRLFMLCVAEFPVFYKLTAPLMSTHCAFYSTRHSLWFQPSGLPSEALKFLRRVLILLWLPFPY